MLSITNTLSSKKELFTPRDKQKTTMYVCGITPYDYAHLGHGRCYVTFDLLYRFLTALGHEITYCRNFTDIDDKIITKAQQEFGDETKFLEIADRYIATFKEDIKKLNCQNPSIEPRVTQTIPEIIEFVAGLIKAGKAYEIEGDVYYRIAEFPEYGKLSKQKLDELRAGARVELSDKKRDPLDFALWKNEPKGHFWESPWGWGRPGWHIECSAMTAKFLGKTIDIHGGGMDLIFPHHENEIAQSEGLFNQPLARYWIHNGFVRVNQVKMSKSLGNFFTLRDIYEKFDPMVIRFYFLNHQYKAPLEFSLADLEVMKKTYQRLCKSFISADEHEITNNQILNSVTVQRMMDFLYDDLNTPGMLGILFESLSTLKNTKQEFAAVKKFLQDILGLKLDPLPEQSIEITPEIQQLINDREKARAEKNWKQADQIRNQLKQLGFDVQDKKL